jgi:hypothetical protein
VGEYIKLEERLIAILNTVLGFVSALLLGGTFITNMSLPKALLLGRIDQYV